MGEHPFRRKQRWPLCCVWRRCAERCVSPWRFWRARARRRSIGATPTTNPLRSSGPGLPWWTRSGSTSAFGASSPPRRRLRIRSHRPCLKRSGARRAISRPSSSSVRWKSPATGAMCGSCRAFTPATRFACRARCSNPTARFSVSRSPSRMRPAGAGLPIATRASSPRAYIEAPATATRSRSRSCMRASQTRSGPIGPV